MRASTTPIRGPRHKRTHSDMPGPTLVIDEKLKDYATDRQKEFIDAVNAHRGIRSAARSLGVQCSVVSESITSVRRKAAILGYSPDHDMTRTVPEGFLVRGVSTLYGEDGKPKLQWVKSRIDDEQREAFIRAAVESLCQDVTGLAPVVPPPAHSLQDILAVYPAGDPHFGMYAWGKESGDDFDLSIARRDTLAAVDRLVSSAPPAHTAIVLPLGDTMHMDDQSNRTPAHGNQLDADGRYVKVLQVCVQTYRHVILRCLEKHQRVVCRFVSGNHDPHASWALAFAISAYFDNEPRVEVDLSPSPFWYYRFGKVLIGATHGDTIKQEQLLGVMAADKSKDWGETEYRYWYTGHIHHQTVKELPGVTCESFRTLAPKDAWAASRGYRAGRDMRLIVHHREFGEIERHRCDVGML